MVMQAVAGPAQRKRNKMARHLLTLASTDLFYLAPWRMNAAQCAVKRNGAEAKDVSIVS